MKWAGEGLPAQTKRAREGSRRRPEATRRAEAVRRRPRSRRRGQTQARRARAEAGREAAPGLPKKPATAVQAETAALPSTDSVLGGQARGAVVPAGQ